MTLVFVLSLAHAATSLLVPLDISLSHETNGTVAQFDVVSNGTLSENFSKWEYTPGVERFFGAEVVAAQLKIVAVEAVSC